MGLPEASQLQFNGDQRICRILNGLWQVSGNHGTIDPKAAIKSMFAYHDAGFTTWDLAEHYGPAADFIGEFRRQLVRERGEDILQDLQCFTKWVPQQGRIVVTRKIIEANIDLALKRMYTDRIDLLQFHWWDYGNKDYLEALKYLNELKEEGKIVHLALTNFDTKHLEIVLNADIPIVSNQVPFSLVDRRPLVSMVELCKEAHVKLLAYGTLCGGLLSETYLEVGEPNSTAFDTASLRKYKTMIDAWGGWELFQTLLKEISIIASRYQVSLANVAVRYVLEQPTVAGAIVGARLGLSEHLADNARVFDFSLDLEDYARLDSVLAKGRNLQQVIGDCGAEYRQ
jgi:aryl-alcohol dehydrogenase-like predicted oxidoreductase